MTCGEPDPHSRFWVPVARKPSSGTDFMTFRPLLAKWRDARAPIRHSRDGTGWGWIKWRTRFSAFGGGEQLGSDRRGTTHRPFEEAWVELDLQGELIGQWTYTASRDESIHPSALNSAGLLYGRNWKDKARALGSRFARSRTSAFWVRTVHASYSKAATSFAGLRGSTPTEFVSSNAGASAAARSST